jgi:undecaprenyl-diphosphatase
MPLPRPASVLAAADLHVVGPRLFLRSMPSGHAMTACAVLCILFLVGGPFWRRPWVLAGGAALAAAIGLARLVSGVHWPADVAAGAALGVATGCASVHLAELTRTAAWLATSPGQWIIAVTQLGAGAALVMDQGYGRTLPVQWILATLAVWAGLRTLPELPWPRLRRREEART